MKRDEENLRYAIRNGYKYVLTTPEGAILRFCNSRAALERYKREHMASWRIYTILEYKNATK